MNAEALLAQYERIAEAPDAIARLRRFVLDLAVRGKLLSQDARDEPAEKLLARISLQFRRAVEEGSLSRPRPSPPIGNADALFALPAGWAFARFGDVVAIQTNLVDPKRHLDMPHVAPDNIESWTGRLLPYGTVREAGVFSGKHLFASGAVLYSKIRPNLAKVTKVDFAGLCSADMYPLHPLIDRDFLVIFMITPTFVDQAVSEENRVAMPKINQAALSQVVVPVPPLAEQQRIVAKVDELMALCDRLEAARTAREATRDRLAAASLARLNTPDPETFPSDARFALAALPALTTRPDQIKHLRQTILNLAVRGKLVPQEAGDEPASELLKRVQRNQALVERSGRRARIAGARLTLEHSDEAPRGWEVVTLAELVTVLNGRAYKQHELLAAGTPVLRVGNLFTSDKWYYSNLKLDDDKHIERGDLIYAWSASFGPFIWHGGRVIYHYHIWKLALHSEEDLDKSYLYNVLLQKTREIKAAGHGISMVHMTKEKMERLQIPVPPLAEQHRIVAKIEELMSLCDALEASLAAATTARTRLLDATLAEALAPALTAAQDIAA